MSIDPHASSVDLAFASAGELLDRLEEGTLTSVDLVNTLLERARVIDSADGQIGLRSIAAFAADALEIAAECDANRARGVLRGPLHGLPVLIKDNIEAAGLPGQAGSTALSGRPARDAALVTRLRDAGAIVLGATNLSEWANMRSPQSTSGWSASGGLVGNPWQLDRSAGGSSSGSGAAVAAGLAPLAVGTETDGSIICPASLSGLAGLKPTVGAVPTTGVIPLSASQDSPGPMARNVFDLMRLFAVLSGQAVPTKYDKEIRFAVATNWRTGHGATDALFDQLVTNLKASGEIVIERTVAEADAQVGGDEVAVLLAELKEDLTSYLASRPGEGVKSLAEVIAYEDQHADIEQPYFGHEFFEQAQATAGRDEAYREARARNLAWAIETCLTPALQDVEVLLAPGYAPAWKSDLTVGGHGSALASPATSPAAIAGWPIATVPMGLVGGLPVGVALLARANDEWTLLNAARRIEAVVNATSPLPHPTFLAPQRG